MTLEFDDTNNVDQAEWVEEEGTAVGIDEDCGPTRVCRNARDFSFDGFTAVSYTHLTLPTILLV